MCLWAKTAIKFLHAENIYKDWSWIIKHCSPSTANFSKSGKSIPHKPQLPYFCVFFSRPTPIGGREIHIGRSPGREYTHGLRTCYYLHPSVERNQDFVELTEVEQLWNVVFISEHQSTGDVFPAPVCSWEGTIRATQSWFYKGKHQLKLLHIPSFISSTSSAAVPPSRLLLPVVRRVMLN